MKVSQRPKKKQETKPGRKAAAQRRTCILVLGMHRSGTSALTRVLSLAGAQLPNTPMEANSGNEKGYWESGPLSRFHDRLLAQLGSSWMDWRPLDTAELPPERWTAAKREMSDLILAEFAGAPLFVVKDPRICRFVPEFLDVLHSLKLDVKVVLPIRNVLEVCDSLEKRDNLPSAHTALLWLRHVLDAEFQSRKLNRVFLSFDQLLSDCVGQFGRISQTLEIDWPDVDGEALSDQFNEFLSPEQRHHTHSLDELHLDPMMQTWIEQANRCLLTLIETPNSAPARKKLDQIRTAFDEAAPLLGGLATALEKKRAEEVQHLQCHVESIERAHDDTRQEKIALEAEVSSRDEIIGQLKEDLTAARQQAVRREADMAAVKAQLALRDKAIGQLDKDLAAARSDAEGLQKQIDELMGRVRLQDAKVQALSLDLDAAERGRAEHAETIVQKESMVAALDEEILHLQAQVEALASERAKYKALHLVSEKAEKEMRTSLLWRMHGGARKKVQAWRASSTPGRSRAKLGGLRQKIAESGLFDADYYLNANPDVRESAVDPLNHFINFGWAEGRDPSPFFETDWYLSNNPDVAEARINPLVHYLDHGRFEGRQSRKASDSAGIVHKLDPSLGPRSKSALAVADAPGSRTAELLSSLEFPVSRSAERGEFDDAEKEICWRAIRIADSFAREEDWDSYHLAWTRIHERFGYQESVAGLARINLCNAERLLHPQNYVRQVRDYQRARAGFKREKGLKVAVYTAISGDYDSLKLPNKLDPRIDYINYRDTASLDGGLIDIRPMTYDHEDPTRKARFVKLNPHKLLSDYDIAIWLDSNVMIIDDVWPLIDDFLSAPQSVAAIPHPERDTIYEEAQLVVQVKKDAVESVEEQIAKYRDEGFEHEDLIESNLMMFDLRDPQVHEFLSTWWDQLNRHSKRDQLSLNYSMWKHGLSWHRIFERPISLRNSPIFSFGGHRAANDVSGKLLKVLGTAARQQPDLPEPTPSVPRTDIVQFTPAKADNAYYTMFADHLTEMGWTMEFCNDWSAIKARPNPEQTILHFHQLEPYYHRSTQAETRAAAEALANELEAVRGLGNRIVLTWHNAYPHDRRYLEIDTWLYDRIAPLVDRAFVLVSAAKPFVERYIDASRIFTVPCPSYLGTYGALQDRQTAREKLGISADSFLFLSVGAVKPYKGHELLAEAWEVFAASAGSTGALLYVAGRCTDEGLRTTLSALDQTSVNLDYIPDDEITTLLGAADVAVSTHREIWTSGSAILAMSHGVPVIVPGTRYTREYVTEGDNGFLYTPGDAADLVKTMQQACISPLLEHMRFINRLSGQRNSVAEIAQKLSKLYHGIR